MQNRFLLLLFLLLTLLFVYPEPVAAVGYVLMSDGDLADRSELVVLAEVTAAGVTHEGGITVTDYRLEIADVFRGSPAGSTLVMRVPGGADPENPTGGGWVIHGAPHLRPGGRAVLFLDDDPDAGVVRPVELGLGVFHVVSVGEREVLVRDLDHVAAEALTRLSPRDGLRAVATRDLERFGAWLRDRETGAVGSVDYMVPPLDAGRVLGRDAGTSSGTATAPLRWFRFEEGSTVRWVYDAGGQPGIQPAAVDAGVRAGIDVWNAVPGADIRYRFTGSRQGVTIGGAGGAMGIVFDDRGNNVNREPYECGGGGVIAVAGTRWIGTGVHDGRQFRRLSRAYVVTNRNTACFFRDHPRPNGAFAAVMGHELGHTLGFDHSDDPEAIMFSRHRREYHVAARLGGDDVAVARDRYGIGGAPPPPQPPPPPAPDPPSAPRDLTASADSATAVLLTWADTSDNETRFEIQARRPGSGFGPVGNAGAGATGKRVGGLDPGVTYTFRVRAFNGSAASGFSNEATATTLEAAPAAPSGLTAVAVLESEIALSWTDLADNESRFAVRLRSAETEGWVGGGEAAAGAESFVVSGLDPRTPYTFAVRAENDAGASAWTDEASATTTSVGAPGDTCVTDGDTLCLLADRFEVRVAWRDHLNGGNGVGGALALPGSDLSGLFTFFDDANVELIVKMLDGRGLNESFWSFYGALSTVEYWISIRDTETGDGLTLHNPPDELCGGADINAFPQAPAVSEARAGSPILSASHSSSLSPSSPPERGTSGVCLPDAQTLCLLDGRFRVSVKWDNPREPGGSGVGRVAPVPLPTGAAPDTSGFFWFFTADNVELVVKMLDARSLPGVGGDFWWFHGGLSDVEYEIEVTDTETGATKTYRNEPFDLCGRADLNAF